MMAHVDSTPSSGNVFADLGLPHPEIERRLADARIAGLPKPIAVALVRLVGAAIASADQNDPKLAAALDDAIEAAMPRAGASPTIEDDIHALAARVRASGDTLVIGYQSADKLAYATAGSLATQLGLIATLRLSAELSAVRRIETEYPGRHAFTSD